MAKPSPVRQPSRRRTRRAPKRPAFLLVLVVVVVAMASLAALNFSQSMLVSHETSRLSGARLQARMCAESAAQMTRLFLAYPRTERLAMGGTWSNPALFQALNVLPDIDPARRGNFTIISPSLDEFGNYSGFRYGLQNESAKLNLLTLAQLDALAASGDMASSAAGNSGGGDPTSSAISSALASEVTSSATANLASDILMALPGMTIEIADAILDYLDEDEEPRPYGAEFSDYYSQLQPAYKPPNGPIQSIEQLLLVRGVTPGSLVWIRRESQWLPRLRRNEQDESRHATRLGPRGTADRQQRSGGRTASTAWLGTLSNHPLAREEHFDRRLRTDQYQLGRFWKLCTQTW